MAAAAASVGVRIYGVTVAGEDEMWVATREGALRWQRTAPGVGEWQHVLNGLPSREVISIRAEDGWLLAAASNTVYVSRDEGQSWAAEPASDFEVTGAVRQQDRLYVLTRQHGVLEQQDAAPSAAEARPAENRPALVGTILFPEAIVSER